MIDSLRRGWNRALAVFHRSPFDADLDVEIAGDWDPHGPGRATAAQIQFGVVAQTLRLALIGVGIGSAASFVVARGIGSLLFGTEPTDPAIFTATVALLGAVALLAGQFPARRASRIDPMAVLRGV